MQIPSDAQQKQVLYRDARFTKQYDGIWQSVNKCVFCDLKDKYIIREENGIVLTITLFAYIDGHAMIIPRRHMTSAKELTQLEWDTVRKFLYIAKKIIKSEYGIKGMQLVQKGGDGSQSTVAHLHFHCIPFDAADLCTWNYRKLTNTPLENAARYKKAASKITKYSAKFDADYQQASKPAAELQLVIINGKSVYAPKNKLPIVKREQSDLHLVTAAERSAQKLIGSNEIQNVQLLSSEFNKYGVIQNTYLIRMVENLDISDDWISIPNAANLLSELEGVLMRNMLGGNI